MLAQELFNSGIDNLPHGIIVFNRERLIYVNQPMLDLLAYERQVLESMTMNEILYNYVADHEVNVDSQGQSVFLMKQDSSQIPGWMSKLAVHPELGTISIVVENIGPSGLQKQLAYMYSIIQDSSQCIVGTDLEGTIVSWNDAAADVYGYTAEDVTGRNISIIMPPDIRFSMLNRIVNGEAVPKQRTYAWTKQGILVNIELSISPIKDEQAQITGISFFSRDISLEKLVEKKMFYQARLLEAVNDSILGTDLKGKIVYWNQGAERMFGWKSLDMLGKYYSSLFVDEDFDDLFNNMQQINTGQWEGIKRVHTSESSKKYVRISINTIYDEADQPDFMVIVLTDISEIIESRLKAEEAVRFKSEFMASISHEIRTPMSSVIGYAELLDENKFDAKEKTYLQGIKQNASQLLDLINDFLDLSKMEANSMLLDEVTFNVKELIYSSLKVFEPAIKKKKLKFNVKIDENVPEKLRGDRVRIRQVYSNLLSNAVKFTKKGEISILVKILIAQGNQHEIPLSISVIDSGIGIPIDKIADVFMPFTQVDSSTNTKYGGTGLGLAISKRLVELMQGSISVQSTPGQGSKFEVVLPLKCADSQVDTTDLRDNSFMTRRKIVLVSENSMLISQFKKSFTLSDYLPVTVAYNKKLQTAINFYQPYAVIIDMENIGEEEYRRWLESNNLLNMDKALWLVYSNSMSEAEVHRYGYIGLLSNPIDAPSLIQLLDERQKTDQVIESYSLQYPILIFDRDQINLKLLSAALENSGFETYTAMSDIDAVNYLNDKEIAILLVDMEVLDLNLAGLDTIFAIRPGLKIIGLKKNDFQYHDKIKIYLNRPYTTQSLLAAINNCLILNNLGREHLNA